MADIFSNVCMLFFNIKKVICHQFAQQPCLSKATEDNCLKFSQALWTVSEHVLLNKKIEIGPGMFYVVDKNFLYGVTFDIVYNENVHENVKKNTRYNLPVVLYSN